MKKLICTLVAITLIAASLMSSVFATEDPQIIVSSVEALAGGEIKLTVSLKNNPGITNGKISVTYDEEGLEFVKIDTATYDNFVNGIQAMSYGTAMNFVSTSDVTADVELFYIYLKVKDDAAGDYAVSVNIDLMKNNAEEDVGFSVIPGTVSVHICQTDEVTEVPATCITDGMKAHQECSVCGKLYIDGVEVTEADLVIPALGHDSSTVLDKYEEHVAPTCTEDGYYKVLFSCAECGLEIAGNYEELPATGHDHEAVVTEPTCTEQGYTTHTCHCGDTKVDSYVEATGHSMGEWYVYAPSTGTAKGEERCDCANCDYYESNELTLLGDVNGDDKVDTTDAKLIMQYDLTMIDGSALDLSVADVNGDGKVDTTDAKLIMQFDLGMIADFPKVN